MPMCRKCDRLMARTKGLCSRCYSTSRRRKLIRPTAAQLLADETGWQKRFRSRIRVDPETGCWHWTGSKTDDGIGMISIGSFTYSVPRLSWLLAKGSLDGDVVMRECETRGCANPDHLSIGTYGDRASRNHRRKWMST